jgi:hypothetical protein
MARRNARPGGRRGSGPLLLLAARPRFQSHSRRGNPRPAGCMGGNGEQGGGPVKLSRHPARYGREM